MPTLTAGSISRYFSSSPKTATSNFALMCERAALSLSSHSSTKCRACEGEGSRVLEPEDLAKWARRIADAKDDKRDELRKELMALSCCSVCKGSGYTTAKRADLAHAMDSMFTTVRCSKCRATGTARHRAAALEVLVGDHCERCGSPDEPKRGYIVPVSVKERGSSKSGRPPKREISDDDSTELDLATASWADEDALVERGRVSRELDRLQREQPDVAQAIAHLNGPDGDKWGQHKWGRAFALWQDTAAGKELAELGAKRSRGGHGYLLPPLELIASEREAEARAGRGKGEARRRALIRRADSEARALLGRVDAVYRGHAA